MCSGSADAGSFIRACWGDSKRQAVKHARGAFGRRDHSLNPDFGESAWSFSGDHASYFALLSLHRATLFLFLTTSLYLFTKVRDFQPPYLRSIWSLPTLHLPFLPAAPIL